MDIKVGRYYQDYQDGEVIMIEEITENKIRFRSTRRRFNCLGNTGICERCTSGYQYCYTKKQVQWRYTPLSKAKGILLLGELDEKLEDK